MMLTLDETRQKALAMERMAAESDGANAAAYRQLAMQWRLLEVEAIFMEEIMRMQDLLPRDPQP
jgi:hypothetical protein